MFTINDHTAAVREVQKYLCECAQAEDFPVGAVVIDGVYGDETRRAVAAFQAKAHLPETGKVDRATFDLLYAEAEREREKRCGKCAFPSGEKRKLTIGCEGCDVTALHGVLSELSRFYPELPAFAPEKLALYHEATARAVREMQKHFCLDETGDADDRLYGRLCLELCARKEFDRIRKSE